MFISNQALAIALLAGSPLTQAGSPHILRQAPANPSALPAGWSYTGCYVDDVNSRLLTGAYQPSYVFSRAEVCIAFCTGQGFPVAGLENGGECFCAPSLPASAVADQAGCTTPCRGLASQACGAPNRLTVYTGVVPSPTSIAPPSPTSSCPAGKQNNLCCRGVDRWTSSPYNFGTLCGYFPPDPLEFVGNVCTPKDPNAPCPDYQRVEGCCAGLWPGDCSMGTNCQKM
ncbi:WSC domain-containing protein [Microdochium trichocladiopsis]|uniref:WSC domain-containing protein n=1 Tax=Microdochium trichocladiopsis TaxID=1682393 RepID=A0A9P8XY35_9PEZI|nr:WSC domain-containing protein [Microdochium trichocladiopsis]KAH7018612.1 WSC domain-containing protein [Microdochium trichocladiopsis]